MGNRQLDPILFLPPTHQVQQSTVVDDSHQQCWQSPSLLTITAQDSSLVGWPPSGNVIETREHLYGPQRLFRSGFNGSLKAFIIQSQYN